MKIYAYVDKNKQLCYLNDQLRVVIDEMNNACLSIEPRDTEFGQEAIAYCEESWMIELVGVPTDLPNRSQQVDAIITDIVSKLPRKLGLRPEAEERTVYSISYAGYEKLNPSDFE
jgi:hypothetical protein